MPPAPRKGSSRWTVCRSPSEAAIITWRARTCSRRPGDPRMPSRISDRALRAAPKRSDLYREAAASLTRNGRAPAALRLLDQAARTLPQDREILLLKATTLEISGQSEAAERLLNEIQNRWPEWYAGWVARGIILATHKRYEDACPSAADGGRAWRAQSRDPFLSGRLHAPRRAGAERRRGGSHPAGSQAGAGRPVDSGSRRPNRARKR